MPTQTTDTIIDRVGRVKHSLEGTGDPRTVQVAVDGLCPAEDCEGRVITTIHADSSAVHCDTCGRSFPV